MFFAQKDKNRGWRIKADYRAVGGEIIDICGALNQIVAEQTAAMMNERGMRK